MKRGSQRQPYFCSGCTRDRTSLRRMYPAAYNAGFDRSFLQSEFTRTGEKRFLTEHLRPASNDRPTRVGTRAPTRGESRALGDVAERLGVKLENAHRASEDAEAALLVLYKFAGFVRVPKAYGALIKTAQTLPLRRPTSVVSGARDRARECQMQRALSRQVSKRRTKKKSSTWCVIRFAFGKYALCSIRLAVSQTIFSG